MTDRLKEGRLGSEIDDDDASDASTPPSHSTYYDDDDCVNGKVSYNKLVLKTNRRLVLSDVVVEL